jgi:dCMP deaminase
MEVIKVTEKRKDYIDWDMYFMGVARLSAQRSKDPSTQVGACIVSDDNKILSVGYNGAPNGYDDDHMPWDSEGDFLNIKNTYVCHAELNAILNNRGVNLKGARMYVEFFPCNECAKAIIQSGIKEIIYAADKYIGRDIGVASKKLLDSCNVKYRQYVPRNNKIILDL